jgi:hypothetical protein
VKAEVSSDENRKPERSEGKVLQYCATKVRVLQMAVIAKADTMWGL